MTHIRQLIRSGELPAHTRLPPIRLLRQLWSTGYFTVQAALSRLSQEGLIVQSTSKGSFVAPTRRSLRSVCLYHQGELDTHREEEFYIRLGMCLYGVLSKRSIMTRTFFDPRPLDQQNKPPLELRNMVKDGEIDAIIATTIPRRKGHWLSKLGVPFAPFMKDSSRSVSIDFEQMAALVVEKAVRENRRVIGLIHTPAPEEKKGGDPDPLLTLVKAHARKNGIRVVCPKKPKGFSLWSWADRGAYACEEILRSKVSVDSLFCFPDPYIHSVTKTLLKHKVSVPDSLLLMSHRNSESALWPPLPVTWLVVKIEDFALGWVKQIEQQIEGTPVEPVMIPVCLEDASN